MVVSATHVHPIVTPHSTMASFDDLRLQIDEGGLRLVAEAGVEAV